MPCGRLIRYYGRDGEHDDSAFTEYIYFAGMRIARRDATGNVFYYSQDMLGSSVAMVEVPAIEGKRFYSSVLGVNFNRFTSISHNHITTAPFAYDAAGNETADAALTYVCNAEGELNTPAGLPLDRTAPNFAGCPSFVPFAALNSLPLAQGTCPF